MGELEQPAAVVLANYIGQRGRLHLGPYQVPVIVVDAKRAYGNLRFKVRQSLRGATAVEWVSAERVTLDSGRTV